MAAFPPQSQRFVGRVAVMARSSAALAVRSGIPGVLLHGMPGGGKTACALELAYGHEHAFDRLAWYKAPDDGMDIRGALADLAFVLEEELPGLQMLGALADDSGLTGLLPRLRELLEQRRMLLVIDNAESLIREGGQWRDPRWGHVVGALTAHRGLGRLILTSRRTPAGLNGLRVEAVNALSPDEALLLARELPHLQALSRGQIPGIDRLTSRQLARRALAMAGGHPKLLELADGQAAQPDQLVEAGGLAADYWHVLTVWTQSVADTLAPGQRDLFWLLCCLEESDRERVVVEAIWPHLWDALGRDGQSPGLDQALTAIAARGLASTQQAPGDGGAAYLVHPGVAAAGRGQAGQPFRDATDTEAAAFWGARHEHASGQADGGSVDTGLLVRAGLAAVSYLLRQRQWAQAATLLQDAFNRDPSRANAAAVLPAIEQITRHQPRAAVVLAKVLTVTAPAAADSRLRACMADAAARGDYQWAAAAAGELVDLCRDAGRLAEALDLAGQKAGYTAQAWRLDQAEQ